MVDPALAERVAERLEAQGDTVAVAEGAAGGLISAALLAVPGASAYYVGGSVIYTRAAKEALLGDAVETPAGLRGASEPWATWLATSARAVLGTTWGIGEGGAAGPANPYGDPAGHAWVAVAGPDDVVTRHVLTGIDDRPSNMIAFATAAMQLLLERLE
ncbi:MAG TPA: CinA family protein [Acidimicrobiales bacterium]|nr:CinA family protein [Acidimicrobiales bacterium]